MLSMEQELADALTMLVKLHGEHPSSDEFTDALEVAKSALHRFELSRDSGLTLAGLLWTNPAPHAEHVGGAPFYEFQAGPTHFTPVWPRPVTADDLRRSYDEAYDDPHSLVRSSNGDDQDAYDAGCRDSREGNARYTSFFVPQHIHDGDPTSTK